MMLPLALSAEDIHKKYNKDHPLIYEDAWDTWPYVFRGDNGEPMGYNIDLLTLIFDELDIPFQVKLKPKSEALESLRKGESDLIFGIKSYYHDEYTKYYSKTVVHLFTSSVAVPKNQQEPINTGKDIATHQVIVHDGSFSHHVLVDSGWAKHVHPYTDMDKAVQLVSSENQGAVLWNTMSLKWLMHRYKTDNLKLEPVNIPAGEYHFMSNDTDLLNAMDEVYSRLASSGKLIPLQNKWFYPERAESSGTPKWVWFIAIAAGLIALLLVIYNLFLKFRERKAIAWGRHRNTLLAQILRSCHMGVWTYVINTKTFTLYKEDGTPGLQYNLEQFRSRYREGDFERLSEAIGQIAEMKKEKAKLQVCILGTAENGHDTDYDVLITVLRKEKGIPTILLGTRRDITEERERQQQVKTLRSRYQSVFSTSIVDMIYFDKNGCIANMNERAQNTFNLPLSVAKEKRITLLQVLKIEDLDFKQRDYFYATFKTNHETLQYKGIEYYEFQLVPVYDDHHELLGIYGTGSDITRTVDAYHNMQNSVKKLGQATQELTDYVHNINYAMQMGGVHMISYSPQTHTLTIFRQMDEVQYQLTQMRCLALIDSQSTGTVRRLLKRMDHLDNNNLSGEVKTILRSKEGKSLYLQIHFFPVLDADGKVTNYSGLCRDVSEIKHTEALLQKETARAQEAETIKNSFLRNMCYEIRTPLNTVVGFAELFDYEHSLEDEAVFIQEIKDNSAYLLRLINDILFLSRLDANMIEFNPQPCDFTCTFEAHCQSGWLNHTKEGVKYVVENPYNKLVVDIDDAYLGRVIEQLTRNAAEHTNEGTVYARFDYIGRKLVIAVNDTGTGISDDTLAHIFERFRSGSSNKDGTGLGLPICKELIEQLGGTIDISTEVGKGTSVWITLPCKATVIDRKKEI